MKSIKPSFQVYATQGGGFVKLDGDGYVFIKPPHPGTGLSIGDDMPSEWGIAPVNNFWIKKPSRFCYGHFPKGTVCEVYVEHVHTSPIIVTVTSITKTGPDNYVITTDTPGTVTDFFGCNINHVTRIIKRGNGVVKLGQSQHEGLGRYVSESTTEVVDYLRRKGHRGNYATFDLRRLVMSIADSYANGDMVIDVDRILLFLEHRNVIKKIPLSSEETIIYDRYSKVSKKKLRKVIKQLLNKCLLPHAKAQQEEDEKYNQALYRELDDEVDVNDLRDCDRPSASEKNRWYEDDYLHDDSW